MRNKIKSLADNNLYNKSHGVDENTAVQAITRVQLGRHSNKVYAISVLPI